MFPHVEKTFALEAIQQKRIGTGNSAGRNAESGTEQKRSRKTKENF